MSEHLIDLKALLVERPDCDAGTVQQLRNALAQGGTQFKSLRDVADVLKKKLEGSAGAQAKTWHLKLGIASFFLGHTEQAIEHLRQADTALSNFYLGRAQASKGQYDEALKAFDKSEKAGYNQGLVRLQRASILRLKGDTGESRKILDGLKDLSSHSAEYHFQTAMNHMADGDRMKAIEGLERAVKLDPGHTNALFQLGHANDLAGNDEEAIGHYEACLKHPPFHVGTLINLGVLYEDHGRYDKAEECYRRVHNADPSDEEARLFLKDAQASRIQYYDPQDEQELSKRSQILDVPVTDFELSVRARNCLKKMNIKTLGDLTRVSEQQLLASKNFGETSLAEIKEMMQAKGLRLGQSIQGDGSGGPPRFISDSPVSDEEMAVLNTPVSDLNLSVRARKCMNKLGIVTLGDLTQRSSQELLEAKNFGQTSLQEVREKLQARGLSLRED
ncbi:MAG: tetratricopeptide repeat protein [Gemmataceae bacterium]|nr:tetratricopeptide repeat protein [Gemmataceae bacterium]